MVLPEVDEPDELELELEEVELEPLELGSSAAQAPKNRMMERTESDLNSIVILGSPSRWMCMKRSYYVDFGDYPVFLCFSILLRSHKGSLAELYKGIRRTGWDCDVFLEEFNHF